MSKLYMVSLQWRHNGRDVVSNDQPRHCLLNRLFWRRSKKTSKLRVTGLCAGNSPVTGEFPAQMASNAENVSIWWRHHVEFEYWNLSLVQESHECLNVCIDLTICIDLYNPPVTGLGCYWYQCFSFNYGRSSMVWLISCTVMICTFENMETCYIWCQNIIL